VCSSRTSQREVQGLDARLWTCRLVENGDCTGKNRKSVRDAGADGGRGSRVLSADILVLLDESARQRRVPVAEDQNPGRVADRDQERRVPIVPPAWDSRNADDSQRTRRI